MKNQFDNRAPILAQMTQNLRTGLADPVLANSPVVKEVINKRNLTKPEGKS